MTRRRTRWIAAAISIAVSIPVFLVPFAFIVLTAMKSQREAAGLEFSWPSEFRLFENLYEVITFRNFQVVVAFVNSTLITVFSVALLVILGSMVAFVLQRRRTRWNTVVSFLVLTGLIAPPAVVPTIWALQGVGLFGTLPGIILVEVAFGLSFTIFLVRAFVANVPRELDEAALIDGAGTIRVFFSVIFPLLRPVIVTVIVVQSVAIFNDFANPLYFLPGDANATVQLTLYYFQSQFETSYNLLFADILLITIPPLLLFVFFSRQIVAGMAAGAVKG